MTVNFNSSAATNSSSFNSNTRIPNIESILNNIQIPLPKLSPEDTNARKIQYKAELNNAYHLVVEGLRSDPKNKTYLSYLSNIMTKFARLRYEEGYPSCMVMMRGSLNAQFAALDIFNTLCFNVEKFSTLEQLEDFLFLHSESAAFDQFMLDSDMTAIADKVANKNLPTENLMRIGFTLLWYSNGLLNTLGFKENEITNNRRFSQVYALCEKILQAAHCEAANHEIAELYYNGLRGFEFKKDPKNIEGAHQWLDKAKLLNPGLEMAARVANLKSCDWAAIDTAKAKQFLDEAIQIRQSFPVEAQDPLLVANLQNRKAGFLIKEGKIEEADQTIDLALEYAEAARGPRDPNTGLVLTCTPTHHQFLGTYDFTKAKIKLAQGKPVEALKFVNRALETFTIHKQSSEDLIKAALIFRALLTQF